MRYVIIGPYSKASTLNQMASQLDPQDGSDSFGAVRLSADGTEPPTHTGCNTLMSESVWAQAEAFLDSIAFPVSIYRTKGKGIYPGRVYRYDDGSWVSVGTGRIFDLALEDQALQRIQTEEVLA